MISDGIKILSVLTFLLMLFIVTNQAQIRKSNFDNIPRERLITNEELINLLDSSIPPLHKIISGLQDKGIENIVEQLAEYFRTRRNVKYFFEHSSVKSSFEELIKDYPDKVSSIVNKANNFINNYGVAITWKLPGFDKLGRKLTPNTIRYLSRFPTAYEEVAKSYLENKNDKFKVLLDQVKDFINDYEKGKSETGGNDVFERFYAGHRIRNLLFAHNLMLGSKSYKWTDQIFMLKVFILHAAKLIDVCKKFHWGNHQLHGLAGLYETTIMYPEIPIMKYWNELALKIIMKHISKEIKDDGFQFERASHYFKLDIMNYFRIYKISKLNHKSLPVLFEKRFHRMFDAIIALSMPDKRLPVLNDAQAIYKKNSTKGESNNIAELSDPPESLYMSIGAAEFNSKTYKYFASKNLPIELFWFFNDSEREHYKNLTASKPKLKSIALTDSKYYVMRTGWDQNDLYLVIDGGLAKFKPDHSHGGILGISAYGYGDQLLPTYRVRYSDPSYKYMKNSLVKNVALVDNILQGQGWIDNKARTGFGIWKSLPVPTVNEWISGDNFDYFSGSHNGYKKIDVNYTRNIIFFKPYFWLILDNFSSSNFHSYQQIWQGNFNLLEHLNGIVKEMHNSRLYIVQSDYSDMQIKSFTKYQIHTSEFIKNAVDNYTFSTLVFPQKNSNTIKPSIREFNRKNYMLIVVKYGNRIGKLYFNSDNKIDLDELNSDAKFIAASFQSDRLENFIFYNGTSCRFQKVKITCDKPSTIEVILEDGGKWNYKVLKGKPNKVILKYL